MNFACPPRPADLLKLYVYGYLSRMRSSRLLEREATRNVGYHSGEEIKRCEEQGIVTLIPKVRVSPKSKQQLFTKDDFRYDPLTDTYICPEGARLTHRFTTPEREGVKQRYYRTTACTTCVARPVCTGNNRGRTIKRLMDEDVLERMAQRLKTHPEKMRLRGQLVEHPFGTMRCGRSGGVRREPVRGSGIASD